MIECDARNSLRRSVGVGKAEDRASSCYRLCACWEAELAVSPPRPNRVGLGPNGGGRMPAVRARNRSPAHRSANLATTEIGGADCGQFFSSEGSNKTYLLWGP